MTKAEFDGYRNKYARQLEQIREAAHELHQNVNEVYGDDLPYGFHLDMVAEGVISYGHLVCAREEDVIPLFFGCYYHDSIEDARLSYNDVLRAARKWMTEEQALMATEIVYALTNDKGRTREERAAPFVKLCDRLANVTYSCSVDNGRNGSRMREVYKGEMGKFLPALISDTDDQRRQIPFEVITALAEILIDEVDRDEIRRQWNC